MPNKDLESIISSMESSEGLSFCLVVKHQKPAAMISSVYEEAAKDFGLKSRYAGLSSTVIVSYSNAVLKDLHKAIESRDNFKIGVALGYPEDACGAFLKDGWDGTRFFTKVSDFVEKTGKLPLHLAYLPYVPEPDAVENEDSESSALGKTYMQLIREEFPKFSHNVEENFKDIVENIKYFKD